MVVITWSNDVMWFWIFFNMNCLEVCTQCPFVLPLPPPPSPSQLISSTTISLKKHISQTPIFHSYTQLPHTHHQHIFSQTHFSFHTLIRPDTQLISRKHSQFFCLQLQHLKCGALTSWGLAARAWAALLLVLGCVAWQGQHFAAHGPFFA